MACKSIRKKEEKNTQQEEIEEWDTRKRKALILMEKTNKTFHFCQIVVSENYANYPFSNIYVCTRVTVKLILNDAWLPA